MKSENYPQNQELETEMSSLGERIRQARKDANLTQQDLAEKMGITKGAVSSLENGISKNIRQDNLFSLAKATGHNPQWIATGLGDPKGKTGSSASKIPLIPLDSVNTWVSSGELPQAARQIDRPTAAEMGPRSYAIEVEDESLGLLATKGSILAIDPDIEPEKGKIVVFHIPGHEDTLLGIYVRRADQESLKFLDGSTPISLDGATYCGKAKVLMERTL